MNLFKKSAACCCNVNNSISNTKQAAEGRKQKQGIQLLGMGCAKCKAMEAAVTQAISELGLDLQVEHVTNIVQIASYGVITTPAVAYKGVVLFYGNAATSEEVKRHLIERIEREKN